MKIEQLLVQHFYIAKQVTLQGIGTFRLSPDFTVPTNTDKDIVLPENAVSFQHNSRAVEDESLITYIVQQTRKMKPLASADLESYIMLATQFLNIGKPFKIAGIGMLEKNQLGEYEFSQGQFINTRVEEAEVKLKEKTREDVSFSHERSNATPGKNKIIGGIVAAIAAIALLGGGTWFFLNNKKNEDTNKQAADEKVVNANPTSIHDTTSANLLKPDTSKLVQHKPDSMLQTKRIDTNITFKVVLKNYPSLLLAQKTYYKLTGYGYKLLLYTSDSVTYKIAMPFKKPLTDTTAAIDSVRKEFSGKPYVDLK